MRRGTVLAACAAAGLAGCRGSGGAADGTGTDPSTDDETASEVGTNAAATDGGAESTTGPGTPTPRPTREPTTARTPTGTPVFPGYERTRVRVTTPEGDALGSVTAAVADTPELRYTGLSEVERLPEDRGMLFVYDSVGQRTYVMREMDFGLDIVYADDEGAITRIHHAPAPGPTEDGEDQEYPGTGQYVLEVNRGWTTERGVEVGDLLQFEL